MADRISPCFSLIYERKIFSKKNLIQENNENKLPLKVKGLYPVKAHELMSFPQIPTAPFEIVIELDQYCLLDLGNLH